MTVETVRGPVDVAALGVTLMHEHVFVLTPDLMQEGIGDTNDLDHLKRIMDQGATIGCDRFGPDMYNTTADRVATIAVLCEQGYADRIVLSQDASCYIDFFSGETWQATKELVVPNWHFEHIHRDVLPALGDKGVTEEHITAMLVDNPRRYFTPREG